MASPEELMKMLNSINESSHKQPPRTMSGLDRGFNIPIIPPPLKPNQPISPPQTSKHQVYIPPPASIGGIVKPPQTDVKSDPVLVPKFNQIIPPPQQMIPPPKKERKTSEDEIETKISKPELDIPKPVDLSKKNQLPGGIEIPRPSSFTNKDDSSTLIPGQLEIPKPLYLPKPHLNLPTNDSKREEPSQNHAPLELPIRDSFPKPLPKSEVSKSNEPIQIVKPEKIEKPEKVTLDLPKPLHRAEIPNPPEILKNNDVPSEIVEEIKKVTVDIPKPLEMKNSEQEKVTRLDIPEPLKILDLPKPLELPVTKVSAAGKVDLPKPLEMPSVKLTEPEKVTKPVTTEPVKQLDLPKPLELPIQKVTNDDSEVEPVKTIGLPKPLELPVIEKIEPARIPDLPKPLELPAKKVTKPEKVQKEDIEVELTKIDMSMKSPLDLPLPLSGQSSQSSQNFNSVSGLTPQIPNMAKQANEVKKVKKLKPMSNPPLFSFPATPIQKTSSSPITVSPSPGALSKAIATAEPYSTLHLTSGIYRDSLTIDKPLTIIGNESVIQGDGARDCVLVRSPEVFMSSVTIEQMSDSQSAGGVRVRQGSLHLTSCKVSTQYMPSIASSNTGTVFIQKCQLKTGQGTTVTATDTSIVLIEDTTIEKTISAVSCRKSSKVSLLRVTIEETTKVAVTVANSASLYAKGCELITGESFACLTSDSSQLMLDEVKCSSKRHAIYCASSVVYMTGCVFSGPSLEARDGSGIRSRDCKFEGGLVFWNGSELLSDNDVFTDSMVYDGDSEGLVRGGGFRETKVTVQTKSKLFIEESEVNGGVLLGDNGERVSIKKSVIRDSLIEMRVCKFGFDDSVFDCDVWVEGGIGEVKRCDIGGKLVVKGGEVKIEKGKIKDIYAIGGGNVKVIESEVKARVGENSYIELDGCTMGGLEINTGKGKVKGGVFEGCEVGIVAKGGEVKIEDVKFIGNSMDVNCQKGSEVEVIGGEFIGGKIGILIDEGGYVKCSKSRFREHRDASIAVGGKIQCSDSFFSNCGFSSIYAFGKSEGLVEGNEVTGNEGCGIHIDEGEIEVKKCRINGHRQHGVYIGENGNPGLYGNTFTNNGFMDVCRD